MRKFKFQTSKIQDGHLEKCHILPHFSEISPYFDEILYAEVD